MRSSSHHYNTNFCIFVLLWAVVIMYYDKQWSVCYNGEYYNAVYILSIFYF